MDENTLIGKIKENLKKKGYGIQENIEYGDYKFLLVGHLSKFEVSKFGTNDYFFTVGKVKEPILANIRDLSNQSFGYSGGHRSNPLPPGIFGGYWVFPIIMVESVSESVSNAIQNEVPPKHWSSAEFPIVVDLTSKKTYYFQGTPIWGAAYYAGFRQLINEIVAL